VNRLAEVTAARRIRSLSFSGMVTSLSIAAASAS
jgi:hypothetical protein